MQPSSITSYTVSIAGPSRDDNKRKTLGSGTQTSSSRDENNRQERATLDTMSSSKHKDPTGPPRKLSKNPPASQPTQTLKPRKSSFFQKISLAFRHKPSQDPPLRSPGPSTGSVQLRNHLELRDDGAQNNEPENQFETVLDTQLGELKDNTKYLHSLFFNENSQEEEYKKQEPQQELLHPSDHVISKLPKSVWENIIRHLEPADACSLTLSSKLLLHTIGLGPIDALNLPAHRQQRIAFLLYLDKHLPLHLLCFLCASYHLRLNLGKEILKPAAVFNPLYNCPRALTEKFPRTRVTPRRNLPFGFAQLVIRAQRYGPQYGLPIDSLGRRWQEEGWSHQSRFAIIKSHLFMRVSSSCFVKGGMTESETRLLLYSREDYSPYFSACAHWRDGLLMPVCKCALSHVPSEPTLGGFQAVGRKIEDRMKQKVYDPSSIVILCENCRPMRRCPECPSEYLIEMKRMEDRSTPGAGFKRAMTVTRWADLGDGITPYSLEWKAVNGELPNHIQVEARESVESVLRELDEGDGGNGSTVEGGPARKEEEKEEEEEGKPLVYDSFKKVGKRSISGIFESHLTEDTIPGQQMLSLNPRMEKHSDVDDPAWY